MKCKNCETNEAVKYSKYSSGNFCCKSCACTYSTKHIGKIKTKCFYCGNDIEVDKRVSNKICPKCKLERDIKRSKKYIKKRFCRICGSVNLKKRKLICDECKESYYKHYRVECNFIFNLNDYPNEFDFSLIEQYGWYKAKNRGNNLNGVSRDHMFSVKDGFKLGISPEIIKHPANCKLVRHRDNQIKYFCSSMTLNELKNCIEKFDEKYVRVPKSG